MSQLITGLHHITAFAGDPQQNVNFYSGILGLRLLKKTVNFDANEVYHLYYGNEKGDPGSLTFFPYSGIQRGKKGLGQVTVTAFSIPANSLEYWVKRLGKFGVRHNAPQERFEDEVVIYFEDHDGLGIELIANERDDRPSYSNGIIPEEHAIKGFYGAGFSLPGYEKTGQVLTEVLDHKLIVEKGSRFRYSASGKAGDFIDIIFYPNQQRGLSGGGTVHHIAFATPDYSTQVKAQERIANSGLQVTPVLDRSYFKSIYFREPQGILFEVATIPPGFALDEEIEHLGKELKLPEWLEGKRSAIEQYLPPIFFDKEKFRD
jgi:glyoxalase family protein